MISLQIIRQLHRTVPFWASQTPSALSTLRKKTGYTFTNCKKALEINNNDLVKAEKWLKEQAQTLGWTKATKLQGRQTTQGLVGVSARDNLAAMVELNCETDFVARNENFQKMVDIAVNACLGHAEKLDSDGQQLVKLHLDTEDLKSLTTSNGKSLADSLALMIGTIGENASLRRGICYKIGPNKSNTFLSCYAHPSGSSLNGTQLGKFGGVAVLSASNTESIEEVGDLGKKICQHIVGLDPKKIGNIDNDVPEKNIDDEKCLIFQEYLLDESITVDELLKEYELKVLDFKRFECGGESEAIVHSLDTVETCQ